ncbi:hypothetical protein QYM36_019118 [Artemia franciscana]|uniref:Uncharacterized protein n=1 Tax=Artemia franciscana TaxID=6661 RepID=A0AA88HB18_ARTSF|nr:hypothetical protein QYM36_019118 [Artemia franciscana]
MPHELLPVSPALFERTGTGADIWLRTGSKAALIDSVRMLSAIDSWPVNVTLRPEAKQEVLQDFMAFIRTRVLSKTATFENFACRIFRNITKELTDLTKLHVVRQIRWPAFDKGPRGLSYSPKKEQRLS